MVMAEMTANIAAASRPREILDVEFAKIRALLYRIAGISLSESKRDLVYRRLSRRIMSLGLTNFSQYYDLVTSGSDSELMHFCDCLTTNFTAFFREPHHFEFLKNTVFPSIEKRQATSENKLRIWSAGCSSGEEPYSIGMTVLDGFPNVGRWDARILATDLDSNVMSHARRAVYPETRFDDVPKHYVDRYFRPDGDGQRKAKQNLRDSIAFNRLNLMDTWPMKGKFDVIFCRNVIIYFDKETQRRLIRRFADVLHDGGYLIVGHSESLLNVSSAFEIVGSTVHQKI